MYHNTYGSALEHWKVRLIEKRARQMGFRGQDLDDTQQRVAIAVMAFQYDPARNGGATEKTALTALINRQLLAMLRSRKRYRNRLDILKPDLGVDKQTPEPSPLHHEDRIALLSDVRRALTDLSSEDRQLCAALGDGCSVAEIARRMDCGWHTINRRIARIRKRFQKLGLDAWICN